jgi:uncharacterized protein YceK
MMMRLCLYLMVIGMGLVLGGCSSGTQEDEDQKGYFKAMARTVEKTKAIQKEMAQRMVDATGSISRTDNTKK